MADLRKWFHPLVLVNEQKVSPYRNSSTSIYQILQHVYDARPADESVSRLDLRLLDLPRFLSTGLDQLNSKYLNWIRMTNQTYLIPEEAQFIPSIQPYLNVSSEIVLNELNVNDLSTFDHPVASINVINSLEADPLSNLRSLVDGLEASPPFASEIVSNQFLHVNLFIRYRCFVETPRNQEFDEMLVRLRSAFPEMLFYEIFIETMVAENGYLDPNDLQVFGSFINDFSSTILPQHLQKFVAAGMLKINSPSNVTYGFASKFLSISKKYIPTGGLFKQETATKSLTTISTLTYKSSEYESRRVADICFMLGNFKDALGIYDDLTRDFQSSKAWAHHYSAIEWSMYAKCMIEEDYLVNFKPMESAVQFYMSHEEYHLNALKVLSLMMLTPNKLMPNALFRLCSHITQASVAPLLKVSLMIQQAIIAITAEPAKNRLASFLFMLAASIANSHELFNYAIAYQKMSIKHIGDAQDLARVVKFRLVQLLEKYSVQPELLLNLVTEMLTSDRALSLGEQELCVRILARQESFPTPLRTHSIAVNDFSFTGQNGESSGMNLVSCNFKISDLSVFEKYCEAFFLSHSLVLDPLDVLLANEEQSLAIDEKCRISFTLTNKFHFGIQLSGFKLHFIDQGKNNNNISFHGEIGSINLPDGSSTVLYFPIAFSRHGKYRPTHMTCMLSGRIPLQLNFSDRGFRLNYKKKHRLEDARSLNHRMILNVSDAAHGRVDFVGRENEPVFAWEKGIVTMKLSNPNQQEPSQVSIIVLQGSGTTVDNSSLDNLSIAAGESVHKSFNVNGLQGATDLVFGIAWKRPNGYRHQIIRHRLLISEGFVLSRHAIRGAASPTSRLLVAQLVNKSTSPMAVKSMTLVAGDVRIDSMYSGGHLVEANANHFASFLLFNPGQRSSGIIEICVADVHDRLLRFPLTGSITHPSQSTIAFSEKTLDDTGLVPVKIQGDVDETWLHDNPKTQSMWVGDLIRNNDDGLRDTQIFAGNGEYAHLRVPSSDPNQTYDIILTNS